nr:DNAhel 2 [Apis mellifera nudivirus]
METLSLRYFQYQALEMQLSGRLTGVEFISSIIALLRRAQLPNMLGSLVILDEYTVVPKPLLLLILLLLKLHGIGTIVCGDRNQLQNIRNSSHTRVSSYELVRHLATATFSLDINERCNDAQYNRIIDYVASFSCERRIDEFACSLIAAIFPHQLMGNAVYADTHLAATHRELAHVVHNMVINEKLNTSFYYIEPSSLTSGAAGLIIVNDRVQPNGLLMPQMVKQYIQDRIPDKFLPYLPLCVGTRYYLFAHSETMQATLKEIVSSEEMLVFELFDKRTVQVRKCANNDVVFEPHRLELLGGDRGRIFNYPIYPANIMTVHKCQGCTIHTKLDLHLTNVTYQGLYVALSRVRDPQQIVRITIPNTIAHLCSVIVNFPELCSVKRGELLNDEILVTRLNANYILYQPSGNNITIYAALIADFFESSDSRRKTELRDILIARIHADKCEQRIISPITMPEDNNGTTLLRFLEHQDIFISLACLEDIDRAVWLHEYIRCTPTLMPLINMDRRTSSSIATTLQQQQQQTQDGSNVLAHVANLNNNYPMSRSTLNYLEARAKQEVRLLKVGSNEQINQQKRILHYEGQDDYLVILAGSEFQACIYRKLKETNDQILEQAWLLEQLAKLIDEAETRIELEPEKTVKNNNTAVVTKRDWQQIDTRFMPLDASAAATGGLIKRRKRRIVSPKRDSR